MKFNWKLPLIAVTFLAGSLFSNYTKAQEKSAFADSIMTEAEKYPTTTHFGYSILENSDLNFHDVNKLESIIKNVENQCEKKKKYSKEEVVKILRVTDNEIKNFGLKIRLDKFNCDDFSRIHLAVGEKFNLPLFGVEAPKHFFIRYDPDSIHNSLDLNDLVNKGDFDWETINAIIADDRQYINQYNISLESIRKGIFMKNLTKQELIAQYYDDQGVMLAKIEDYDSSIQSFNDAIKLDSNDSFFYSNLGLSLFYKGDYLSAIKSFNNAIELFSSSPIIYNNRGMAFLDKKEYSFAIQDFYKAIELDSNFAKPYYNLGIALYYKEEFDLAIKEYSKAIKLDSTHPNSYYNRGLSYEILGDSVKANADFKKYKELKR